MVELTLIERAQEFAHIAHASINQTRKYPVPLRIDGRAVFILGKTIYAKPPYHTHTDSVAARGYDALVKANGGVVTTEIQEAVAGYHLHDFLEDVLPELKRQGRMEEYEAFKAEFEMFPALTQRVTHDLTDVFTKEAYPKMNRKERHANENERIGTILPISMTGKLSDLIDNTESIVEYDPDFARVYLKEKLELLPRLVQGNSELLAIASQQVVDGHKKLGLPLLMVGR